MSRTEIVRVVAWLMLLAMGAGCQPNAVHCDGPLQRINPPVSQL